MALYPVKLHFPFQVLPTDTVTFTVEDNIDTIKFVFDPLLRFYNITTLTTFNIKISHTLDLGFGSDPLTSGSFTINVVDQDVGPGAIMDFAFTPQIDLDTTYATQHVVTLENLSATETEVVRCILFGYTETQVQLPASQSVIKNT